MKRASACIVWLLAVAGFAVAQSAPAPVPFLLTIAAEQLVVKSGSEVVIDIALKNTSNHDLILAECNIDGLDQYLSADVRDERGQPADGINCDKIQFSRGCAHERGLLVETASRRLTCSPVAGRVLRPGESLSSKVPVSKLFDMGVPGKYTIEIERANYPSTYIRVPRRYGGYEDLAMEDKRSWGTEQSNTVTVTVTQ